MIRINLLDSATRKEKSQPAKGKLIALFGIIAAVVVISGTAYFAYDRLSKDLSTSEKPKKREEPREDINVSSRSDVVEDVVDGDAVHKSGINSETGREYIPYDELTYNERLNYEINFAREVFSILSRCLPDDAEFTEISIKEFDTLVCKGIEETKDNVKDIFWAFSGEKVAFDPKPRTYIRESGRFYNYKLVVKVETGLDLRAPFIDLSLSFLPSEKDLYVLNDRIEDVAENLGLSFVQEIKKTDAYNEKKYSKHEYAMKCKGRYAQFVSFVKTIYSRKVPCAFKKIKIEAESPSRITADCVIQYTTND